MCILGEIPNQIVALGINTLSIMHRANFIINLLHYVLIQVMRALCILSIITLST
jgi:hypothetical protein